MTPERSCDKNWFGRDGKEHGCILPDGHGLVCECDCGERKWMGTPLAKLFRLSKKRYEH